MSTYKPYKPTFAVDTNEVDVNVFTPTLENDKKEEKPKTENESTDKELLERIKTSRSLRDMSLGTMQLGKMRDDLRKQGINPVSTEYVKETAERNHKLRESFGNAGMTIDDNDYIDLSQPIANAGIWAKRIDNLVASGLAEEHRDAGGKRIGITLKNDNDISPYIDRAYISATLPTEMSDIAQSDYFSELTSNVIEQLPRNKKGEILYSGVPYQWAELYEAFYPVVADKAHNRLLEDNKDYYNWAFESAMGMTYEEWYKNYADKRVGEIEQKVIELRDAVAEESAQIAEGRGREVALSSGTLVPASVLGWASKEGARMEASKQFNDVLESIESFRNNGFASGFDEGFDWLDALSGGLVDLGTTYSQFQLIEKAKRGETLSNSESKVLELLQLTQEFEGIKKSLGWERTLANSVGSGLGTTVTMAGPFAVGMAGVSGVGTTVKLASGIAKGASKKAVVKQVGKNMLHNLGTAYKRGAIVAPFMASTYTTGLKELQEQYTFNPEGGIKYEPKSKSLAFLGGYIDTMNEFASEVFGSTIGEILGYGARTFGRVTRLNKAVDAVMDPINNGLSKAIDKGLSYLPIEDEAKLAGLRKALRGMIVPNAELDEDTKELMRMFGVQEGKIAEASSEVFGDFMSQVMRDIVGAKTDYSEFEKGTYWETQLLVAVLYGGAMNAVASVKEGVSDYQQIVDLGKYNKKLLGKIENRDLRNKVLAALADGNIEEMSARLADLMKGQHPTDQVKVLDYARNAMMIQTLTGKVEDGSRVDAFVRDVAKLSGVTYMGQGDIIMETTVGGRQYYIVDGKPADKSESSMLTCIDKETGERKAILASALSEQPSIHTMADIMQQMFIERFSAQTEATRLSSLQSAYDQMDRPTAEIGRDMMQRYGITPPAEGDVVTLADGRQVKVTQDLEDGTYVVRLEGPEPKLFTIPFYSIRSNNPLTAEAQTVLIEGKVASATNKAVDLATAEVENGNLTEETMTQTYESTTPAEVAESETQTAESIEGTEEQVANDTLDMTNVPTDADGDVDYDAIDDPVQYAQVYAHEAGSKQEASAEVEDLKRKTLEEAAKLEEQSKNEITASAKRKKLKAAKKLRERAAFYDNVLSELEEMEEDYTSIVKNEYSQQVAEPTLRVLDAMAKKLGIKVRFVDEVNGGKANAQITKDGYVEIAFNHRDKSIAFLMGHEFTHHMQDLSPEQYAEFKQMVKDFVGEEAWNKEFTRLKAIYAIHGIAITDTELEDEITADMAGALVEQRDAFLNYLEGKKNDTTFLSKVLEFLHDMVTIFKAAQETEREKQIKDLADALTGIIRSSETAQQNVNGQETDNAVQGKERHSIIGEQGAEALDMADEATTRLDDLAVARETQGVRRSIIAPTFYSNAQYAVQSIKQEKATPEQWLKMIEKAGGLKAGEDKWLGLSDWLKASTAKILTKDEVLQYIAENDIQIEEVSYGDVADISREEIYESAEFAALREGLTEYDEDDNPYINRERYDELRSESYDFVDGFSLDYWGEELKVNSPAAAATYLGLTKADREINETRLNYTTQGLSNKREIALVVPTIEPYNQSDEIHFGDAGDGRAVAWIRFGETTDADGKSVLVIDEIQSKRHQDGREKGYVSDEVLEAQRQYDYLYKKMYKEGLSEEEHNRYYFLGQFIKENYGIVPSAPFEKNWAELAFKRMLRYAAENGYDYVAWTTGDQQADRYNLGKMYDYIEREDNPNIKGKRFVLVGGNYDNFVVDDNAIVVSSSISEANGKSLTDVVGKDMAEKMMSLEDGDTISGDGLRIGGEGMRGFYDQMLPSFVKKYTKKWGAEVGKVTMPDLEENNTMHAVNVTDSMRESVMQGQPKFSLQTINALSDALSDYNTNGDIVAFVDKVREANDKFGKHPYLTNIVMDYEDEGDAGWLAERVKRIVGRVNEGYTPYTAGGVKYSIITDQIEHLFNEAVAGNLTGKSIAVGSLTQEGKDYLEKLSGLKLRDRVSFTLNPSDLVHIHNDHFEDNEKDKGNNIPLTTLDIKRIVDVISFPTAILYGKEKNSGRNLFYFLMDSGYGAYNLLEVYSDRKGNLSTKTYYKTKKDAAQRVMELKKSLLPTSETYSGAILSDAKIPQIFELPKIEARNSLITPEMDASYLDAVERGDMTTAQRMVMEAAKLAMPNTKVVDEDGNLKVVYHGTPNYFNAFSKEMFGTSTDRGIWGNGFYFSDSEQYAKTYEKRGDKQGRTLTVFLNIENPLFISLRNGGNEGAMYFHELMEKHFTDDIYEDATRTDELMSVAQERLTADVMANGYDGIVVEYTNHIDTEYVAFNPNQIKSADPVTYDDAGNVIPLSERFNPEKEDIRYSVQTPSLLGVHNISLDKLRKVIKMGGLTNPSVAVIDVDKQTHDDYGEYSLILPNNMVDARKGKNAGTWAGDAWTPTYPSIIKRMTDGKAISRFYKDIDTLPEAMRSRVKLDFDSFMEGRSANALAYWYLFEKGNAPEMVLVPSRYSDDVTNTVEEATNGSFSMYGLTPEERAKCLDVYITVKFDGDRAAFETEMQARIDRLTETIETKKSDRVKKWAQDTIDLIKEYGFDYDDVAKFIRDVEYDAREKGTVNVDAAITASRELVEANNLEADYDAWRNNLDERYGVKEYIFDGYTNSGDRRYLPHTVENASKWMKKQGRQGAVATFPSFGTFVAVSIPKMTTLESIRKRKALLGKSKEEYDVFREKWENVYYELGKKLQPDAKSFDDYGYWRLIEAVGHKNPKEFVKKEYNIELSEEDMAQLNDMLNAIRTEYPARYFETKFERPLQLSDFVAAVVPNDVPMDVYGRLKDANVEIFEYEKGNSNSRTEAMQKASKVENVRFSLQDVDAQRFNRKVEFIKGLVKEYNIPNPLFIAETKEEFVQMVKDYDGKVDEYTADTYGYYCPDDDIILLNGGMLITSGDAHRSTMHEYAHSITKKYLGERLAEVTASILETEIDKARKEMLPEAYNEYSYPEIIDEFTSLLLEDLTIAETRAIFEGEMAIDTFIEKLKNDIKDIEKISNKDILYAVIPLVVDNLKIQKEQYGKGPESTIVIPRQDSRRYTTLGKASHLWGDKKSRPSEAESRVYEASRGGEGSQKEVDARYSIQVPEGAEEAYKAALLEEAMRMEREATSNGMDIAQEIADATGWVHLANGEWKYYGEGKLDITDKASAERAAFRWLESKKAVKKAQIRKVYYPLIKGSKAQIAEIERNQSADYAKLKRYADKVEYILQGNAVESLPIEDQILVDIALGQRLKWNDGDGKRGLKSELGLQSAKNERMGAVTLGARDYMEDYVERLMERNNGYEQGLNDNDIRNAVIEVFSSYPSPKAAIEELYARYKPDTEITLAEEGLARLEYERDAALAEVDAEYNKIFEDFDNNPDKYVREHQESESYNANLDMYVGSLSKARKEVKKFERDAKKRKLSDEEKMAAMRAVKSAIAKELRDGLGRFTRKYDIQRMMDAVNDARTPYAMLKAIDKAMESLFEIKWRREYARMQSLTKAKLTYGITTTDPSTFLNTFVSDHKITASDARKIMNEYWRGTKANGVSVAKYIDDTTRQAIEFINQFAEYAEARARFSDIETAKVGVFASKLREKLEDYKNLKDYKLSVALANDAVRKAVIDTVDILELYWTAQELQLSLNDDKHLRDISALELKTKEITSQLREVNQQIKDLANGKVVETESGIKDRDMLRKELQSRYNGLLAERAEAYAEMYNAMPDIIKMMQDANNAVETLLRTGRVNLAIERTKRKEREKELISDTLADLASPASPHKHIFDLRTNRAIKNFKANVGSIIGAPLGSMEYMLRAIGRNAPLGEGRLFNHFAYALQQAYDNISTSVEVRKQTLDDKCNQLWGKGYREVQKEAESTKVMTLTYTSATQNEDGGWDAIESTSDIYVTQAMYILATWEQAEGRKTLEKQGFSDEAIDNMREALDAIDPRWNEFADWVVNTYLPEGREKYNKVHREIFGTSMSIVPNYFPIKRAKEKIQKEEDVSSADADLLPSSVVGAIKERTSNVIPIDLDTSFFEALYENMTVMEAFAEMAGIIEDINAILSNGAVKTTMNDISPTLFSDFKKAAQVATLSYIGKTPDIDKNLGTIVNRLWAGSKISFRLYTAFKQLSSAVLFAGYSADPKFQAMLLWRYIGGVGKMPVGILNSIMDGTSILTGDTFDRIDIMTNIEWAKENMPSFAKRWNDGVSGIEIMSRTTSGSTSWKQRTWAVKFDDAVKAVTKFGMKPNAFIDAFTVAAGARAVYDYELEQLQKAGYSKEKAHTLAIIRAEMAFNTTQQSSEGLYISPMQNDRSFLATTLSTFMNAPYAMFRNFMIGMKEIFRDGKKELKEIESMEFKRAMDIAKERIDKQITEDIANGIYSEGGEADNKREELIESAKEYMMPRVRNVAKKKLKDAKVKAYIMVAVNGYVGQLLFNLMAKLPSLIFGDDDEEKKKVVADMALHSIWGAPLSMIPAGSYITSYINGYSASLFPALDETRKNLEFIRNELRKEGVTPEAIDTAVEMILRMSVGINIDTWVNIALAVDSMIEDGMSAEAILKFINAPEGQIRDYVLQRREGETSKEYGERVMRFYSILDTPIFEDYFYVKGKNMNKRSNDETPRGMSQKEMNRIKIEDSFRRSVILHNGGGKQLAEIEETDKAYSKLKHEGYGDMSKGQKKILSDITKAINKREFELRRLTDEDEYYKKVLLIQKNQDRYIERYEQFNK